MIYKIWIRSAMRTLLPEDTEGDEQRGVARAEELRVVALGIEREKSM